MKKNKKPAAPRPSPELEKLLNAGQSGKGNEPEVKEVEEEKEPAGD